MQGGLGDQESDEEIVRRIQKCAGSDTHAAGEAFVKLYTRHNDRILLFILYLLNDPQAMEVAPELTEDTFMKVYDALVVNQSPVFFIAPGKVRAWLNTIAYHEVGLYQRRKRRHVPLDAADKQAVSFIEKTDLRIAIEEAKSKLSPRDKRIIELAYEEGRNTEEIAKILHMEAGAVRMARLRAGKRFAEVYEGPLPSIQGQQRDSPGVSPKRKSSRKPAGRSDK